MNRAFSGVNFWFALAFSFLLGFAGAFILVSSGSSETDFLGWMLVAIGSFFLALNLVLRQNR